MNISCCYTICLLALVSSIALSQELEAPRQDRAYFESLDDVTLQLNADNPEAREVFRERAAHYTPEQMSAASAAYRQALREQECRDGASSEVLLERIRTTEDRKQLMNARLALQERFTDADALEKAAIRESYVASWRAMESPDLEKWEQEIDFDKYFGYLQQLHHYFPAESDALPILEERCVQSGLRDGAFHMYQALMKAPYELGPLTAARAEAEYMATFRTDKDISMNGETSAQLEATLHAVLGKCGPSGMEALQRMGTLKTSNGLEALRTMRTPEAEAILWEIAEDPTAHAQTKVNVLRVLSDYQYRDPSDERLQRFREPVARILALSKDATKYDLQALEEAVLLAVRIGDGHNRKAIVALERALEPKVLRKTDMVNTQGMDPVKYPVRYTGDSLHAAIAAAKEGLK